jgi:hypothetical protein
LVFRDFNGIIDDLCLAAAGDPASGIQGRGVMGYTVLKGAILQNGLDSITEVPAQKRSNQRVQGLFAFMNDIFESKVLTAKSGYLGSVFL